MKVNRRIITACICLLTAVSVMVYTGLNFLAARNVPLPQIDTDKVEQHLLHEWFPGLEGTHGDTPVYVIHGEKPGGSVLILGGTHPNEVSGYMAATIFVENAKVEQGTVYVVPYANHSAMTHNDPGEGNLQYFTLKTKSGLRTFRYGSRATNPIDQWPDPDVYVHASSGQQLSGSETRNLNRAYPGVENGTFTEKVAYGITELIRKENISVTFDLHEASPEYPVINATVAHEHSMQVAAAGCMNLMMEGIEMSLEVSPVNFHGLSHRELGDYTNTLPILMETANASQGRLRGATSIDQVLGGKDKCYVLSQKLGMLYVPYDENGHPIEERVGRHLQGIYEYVAAYNEAYPDNPVVYSNVPDYTTLFSDAPTDQLGGAWLGTFLN